ncbi:MULTISPECIES: hypothetical protein [Bacillus subtilis group]|uniref:hypothetical protein n=1 Tax=Bacillus subtilis group TaxID=653685 RepID=UPI000465D2B8|nr:MULTISPECIES: hypothetical protein [Bacillus subtilis group]MDR4436196.1 hypothetical protein [Bacillus tequilensis]MEC2266464.1 hypothetical protein [Bacillus subtilis]MEC4031971.1 hypothetical protein [Bacillus subtilis]SPT93303.1 Uncharacterised protein [Bacillus tequilensis]SPU01167.1 Uncharacterised protein [Bacillus tequilensis]
MTNSFICLFKDQKGIYFYNNHKVTSNEECEAGIADLFVPQNSLPWVGLSNLLNKLGHQIDSLTFVVFERGKDINAINEFIHIYADDIE